MDLRKIALAGVAVALAGFGAGVMAQGPSPPDARAHVYQFDREGAWLGVSVEDIGSARAKKLGLERETGAEVTSVQPGSPAERADIRLGDVILRYQGAPVESVRQFARLVRETPAGRTVTVELFREGTTRSIEATLEERDKGMWAPGMEDYLMPGFEIEGMEPPGFEAPEGRAPRFARPGGRLPARLEAQVDDLSKQLGEYFGVKDGEGVLVREVTKGGPGERAGLRAGDVIIKVDDEKVAGTRELRRAIRARYDQELTLTVIRERERKTLTVEAPEERVSSGAPRAPRWVCCGVI